MVDAVKPPQHGRFMESKGRWSRNRGIEARFQWEQIKRCLIGTGRASRICWNPSVCKINFLRKVRMYSFRWPYSVQGEGMDNKYNIFHLPHFPKVKDKLKARLFHQNHCISLWVLAAGFFNHVSSRSESRNCLLKWQQLWVNTVDKHSPGGRGKLAFMSYITAFEQGKHNWQ